jgi:hypothetical protein
MKVARPTLVVLAGYFLLTVLMTWPAARHLSTAIPGDGFDGWQNYWNLWWVKEALLVERTNPFFTNFLDAPSGVSLLFHTLNIFNGLWTLPIQLNAGLAIAYNSVVFLSFVLAGYGGYLLTLQTLTVVFPASPAPRAAAFVGGLIFTMAPFHMAHLLGHMQVFSMIWPPFYILWLLRTIPPWAAPGSPPPRNQGRNVLISSLFLVLATLVDWYHTLYLLFFTAIALVWVLWCNRHSLFKKTKFWFTHSFFGPIATVAAIFTGFAIVLLPLLVPMVLDASNRPDLETGLEQNITLSADLLAFVLPSEMHPLWGEWATEIANTFTSTTSERLIFAGFVPLTLALAGLVGRWAAPAVRFWAGVVGIFVVMALGPYLHIGGDIVTVGGEPLPLPYLLLYYTVPFIDLTRSLSRYDLMVMLGLGILAGVGLAMFTRTLRPARATLMAGAATLLICFEFLPVPYPVSVIEIPQFYADIARDQQDYVIAELPMNWDRPTPLLHQTVHQKRLLTSYTSRDNPLELAQRTPVFQHWQRLGPDIIDQPIAEIAPTIFYDFNLKYIVLDTWQMPPGPERSKTEQWVAAALPEADPVYDDGRLLVYQPPPRTQIAPYLSLGDGWGPLKQGQVGMGAIRRVDSSANLYIHHPAPALEFEVTAAALPGPTTLVVSASGKQLGDVSLTQTPTTHRLPVDGEPDLDLLKLELSTTAPISVSRISLITTP